MNNDALFAALGMDAAAAVHGYRLRMITEAGRRGMRLVSEPLPGGGQRVADRGGVDLLDIRLIFGQCATRGGLTGCALSWSPEHGWSCQARAGAAPDYYAGPSAFALDLVPSAERVLDWVAGGGASRSVTTQTPSPNVELDDDPEAIQRLLTFVAPQGRRHGREMSADPVEPQPPPAGPAKADRSSDAAASPTQRPGPG